MSDGDAWYDAPFAKRTVNLLDLLEQFDRHDEWPGLAVEDGRSPRGAAPHTTDRGAGRFRHLQVPVRAAIVRVRHEFAQGEAFQRDLWGKKRDKKLIYYYFSNLQLLHLHSFRNYWTVEPE